MAQRWQAAYLRCDSKSQDQWQPSLQLQSPLFESDGYGDDQFRAVLMPSAQPLLRVCYCAVSGSALHIVKVVVIQP